MDIDLSAITSQPMFQAATPGPDGIWMIPGDTCAIGVVMLAKRSGQIALITKAERPGYEFSDQLAMPGGLVRTVGTEDFPTAFRRSLLARVESESGLAAASLQHVRLLAMGPAPVTGYTVKGTERRTIVIAVEAVVADTTPLHSKDGSIAGVAWYDIPPPWARIAPANRLILASAVADRLLPDMRADAEEPVAAAFLQCASWALEVGAPVPTHPFGDGRLAV